MYKNNRNIKALPRMRTVPEAAAEIKAAANSNGIRKIM